MGRTVFRNFKGCRRRLASFRPAVDVLESRVLLSGITFEDVTAEAGIVANRGFGFSTAWVDFNTDGRADLWIGRHGPNQPSNLGQPMPNPLLYKNMGDGTFVDVFDSVFPPLPASDHHGSAWADVDNDGDPDFLQTVGGGNGLTLVAQSNRLYLNYDGVLVDATRTAGLGMPIARGREAEWIDADRDGLLDVFLSNEIRFDRLSPSNLLLQTGGGWDSGAPFFADRDATSGLAFAEVQDVNGDRLPDIACFYPSEDRIRLLLATETGQRYADGASLLAGITFGGNIRDFAFADFNGDLYADMVVTTDDSRDVLLLFDPVSGRFVDHSVMSGMQVTRGTQVVTADLDNDGDVDIYVACETSNADLPDVIYTNRGNGTFVTAAGNAHTGASQVELNFGIKVIAADFDSDGFVDLFQNGTGLTTAPNQLLRNTGRKTGNTNHWLELDLSGVQSNRDAVGARVELTAGGVTQVRYQTSGKHHFAQNETRLHFGLGESRLIQELKVSWPSGGVTTRRNIAVDQILAVSEGAPNMVPLARPILVESGAGDFRGTLKPGAAQQYFVFDMTADATLRVELTGFALAVEVWNKAGSEILKSGKTIGGFVSIERPLTQGRYLLCVRLLQRAAPSGFRMTPRLIAAADVQGPIVEDIALDETLNAKEYAVMAVVNDAIHGGAALAAAEFFIDTVGAPGTGYPMLPADRNWGVLGELVQGFVPAATWNALSFGVHTIRVRGKDAAGNWGKFARLNVRKEYSQSPALNVMTTAISFSSGVPIKVLFPDLKLNDADSPNSTRATVTLLLDQSIPGYKWSFAVDSRLQRKARVLEFNGVPVAEEWSNPSRLRIRFNKHANPAIMQEVLKRVTLNLTGVPPQSAAERTLPVIVSDGSGGRAGATLAVNVAAPRIQPDGDKITHVEDASPILASSPADKTHVDSSKTTGRSLTPPPVLVTRNNGAASVRQRVRQAFFRTPGDNPLPPICEVTVIANDGDRALSVSAVRNGRVKPAEGRFAATGNAPLTAAISSCPPVNSENRIAELLFSDPDLDPFRLLDGL